MERPRVPVLRFSSHQVAHLGMSLLGPEFRRDHRAPFCKFYFAAVVTLYLAIGDVLEDLCTSGLTEEIKTSTMMFGILWYSSCGVEGLTEESCMVAEIMALLRVAWCPRSGPDLLNQFALEGWSPDTLKGPTPTNPRTGKGVSRRHPGRRLHPNFYSSGTNPRTGHHWTACLCPVKRRR